MKTVGVLFLGLVALTASQGCRQKDPEPIPGPKARSAAVHFHPAGIAWFQGSFEEAFAPVPRDRAEMAARSSRQEVHGDMATSAQADAPGDMTAGVRADAPGGMTTGVRADAPGDMTAGVRADAPRDVTAGARADAHDNVAATAKADTRQPRAPSISQTCPNHRERSTKGTVVCSSC
jgi:hypothetical protein